MAPQFNQPRRPLPGPPLGAGERLDRYLVRAGLAASRRQAREMAARGKVRINGRRCEKAALVHGGDRVEVEPDDRPAALEPEPAANLEILFQDDAVLVVNKPGGIPCHPLRPGERATVMNAVVARFPETASAGLKPNEGGLVHRLDNGTSGALLVARTAEAFSLLRSAIRSGRVSRRYLALVAGELAAPLALDTPIAHHPKSARRMVPGGGGARPAASRVEPLRRCGAFTLVLVTPRTGVRHQIRVHLAAAGHPIVGDALYGGPAVAELAPGRFCLHLAEMEFDSPASGRRRVSAPLAPEFARLAGQAGAGDWTALDWRSLCNRSRGGRES